MVTLRCTRKLLKRLQGKPAAVESLATSTSRLGDWHANLLYLTGGQVILVVNDRTLLPVLVPASPGSTFIARFRSALSEVLGCLGIDPLVIEKELEAMDEVQLSSTHVPHLLPARAGQGPGPPSGRPRA